MEKYDIDALIKEKANKLDEFILTSNKTANKRGVSDFTLIAYIKEHELIEYKCRRCKNDGMWHKKPLPLIIEIGLLAQQGKPYPLKIKGDINEVTYSKKLWVNKEQACFTFENIKQPAIPAILRNFSSPIKLLRIPPKKELLMLMRYEHDPYVRWDATQV